MQRNTTKYINICFANRVQNRLYDRYKHMCSLIVHNIKCISNDKVPVSVSCEVWYNPVKKNNIFDVEMFQNNIKFSAKHVLNMHAFEDLKKENDDKYPKKLEKELKKCLQSLSNCHNTHIEFVKIY